VILAIQREGNRILAAELRPLGLTPSQAEVLTVLSTFQPLTLLGLGELLVCESGNSPSRLVDRMVQAGLVDRETDPQDRRHVTLSLTPQGKRLVKKVAAVEEGLHQAITALVGERSTKETVSLLRHIAAQLPAGEVLQRRRAGG
jgi:DNA-binding MarR family transcriptional regulator